MQVTVWPSRAALALAAAQHAGALCSLLLQHQDQVRLVAATGASQLEFIAHFVNLPLDWRRIELFHLDEYIGIPPDHPASFSRYIRERLIEPAGIERYHLIDPAGPVDRQLARLNEQIALAPIDLTFAGIGENAHLAFNDPPADFLSEQPYITVRLDAACRVQQVNEGWFPNVEAVPAQAISMAIRQILKSRAIVSVVPDRRKAQAVQATLEGPIVPAAPASVLRAHANATLFLDQESASLLQPETLARYRPAQPRA